MALAGFKLKMRTGWEVEPVDLNVAYIPPPDQACVHAKASREADQRIKYSGPTRHKNLKLRRSERTVPVPRVPSQERHIDGAENLNQRTGLLLQSQFETTNRTIISRSSHHPKISVTIKFPLRESCALAPGTCVNYMPRRSIVSKGSVNAHTIEALSLLADVSCEVKPAHIERPGKVGARLTESKGCVNARTVEALLLLADASCEVMKRRDNVRARKLTSKLSGNGSCKERSSLVPLKMKMASVLKKLNELKDQCTNKHTQMKITDSFRVVRKLRTPREPSMPAFRCPTELQKNVGLSKCDEIVSSIRASSASCADTSQLRDRLAMPETSTITSTIAPSKDLLAIDKFSDNKTTLSSIGSVIPLDAKRTASVERVSKCLSQISGAKERPSGRSFSRSERYTNQILQFIGEMTLPEKLIRQALGNNPDTSKALRLLLTERKVIRQGSGGRGRPFVYAATEKGRLHVLGMQCAAREVVELTPESVSSCNPISDASPIASDAPKSDTPTLRTQVTKTPEAPSASDTNRSPPCSVTPHACVKWPLAQTLNCVVSSQSFDLLSSGITEC